MKLNDFINKGNKSHRQINQFVIQNEVATEKYQKEVKDLNAELGKYRTLEAERDLAFKKLNLEKDKSLEAQQIADQLSEELREVKETIAFQETVLEKIPVLEEGLKNTTGQLSLKNNDLDNITKKALEQSKHISMLAQQIEGLKAENQQFSSVSEQASKDKLSAEEEAKSVLIKNIELQTFANETSTINKKLEKDYSEIRDERNFWEKESNESKIQLDESVQVESKLRKWVTDLEKSESEEHSRKGVLNEKNIDLQKTITDMSKVMEDLIKELSYLRQVNKEFRKELSKPRYLSMGAIAKQEGFVMPMGKENIRTQNLGNSAPTLLKFRTEETTNGR